MTHVTHTNLLTHVTHEPWPTATLSFRMTWMTLRAWRGLCDSWASCSLRHGDLRFAIRRTSAILNFRNLEFMSRDLYRHAILAEFNWNRTISCWVMVKQRFLKWPSSAIFNFLNFRLWLRDSHRVPNLRTRFHQNWMIFRWNNKNYGDFTIFNFEFGIRIEEHLG